MDNFHLAILASGNGSTAEPLLPMTTLVITNNPNAGIIERAKQQNVDCIVLPRRDYIVYKENGDIDQQATRLKYGLSILTALNIYDITHISQNGWSLLTPSNVVQKFKGRIFNSHPAPLDPGFTDFGGNGMHGVAVHAAVLHFKRMINRPLDYTEIVIHEVSEEYDKGNVVAASLVKIEPTDTPETLQQRVKEVEINQNQTFWEKIKSGQAPQPLFRGTRLVLPGEEPLVEEAKRRALAQYPHG